MLTHLWAAGPFQENVGLVENPHFLSKKLTENLQAALSQTPIDLMGAELTPVLSPLENPA